MKSAHCSINWGKSFAFVMLVIVFALMVISFGMLNSNATPNGIGVDWGSRPVPVCPPGVKDCKVGVDWGSLTAPCPPTDPNCDLGPVAVDWGDIYSAPPCKLTDPDCQPEFEPLSVDWGS